MYLFSHYNWCVFVTCIVNIADCGTHCYKWNRTKYNTCIHIKQFNGKCCRSLVLGDENKRLKLPVCLPLSWHFTPVDQTDKHIIRSLDMWRRLCQIFPSIAHYILYVYYTRNKPMVCNTYSCHSGRKRECTAWSCVVTFFSKNNNINGFCLCSKVKKDTPETPWI